MNTATLLAVMVFAVTTSAEAASVSLSRTSRPVTDLEIAAGAPAGGFVHEFFVSSDSDLLNIGADPFGAALFQHTLGSDVAAPSLEAIAANASLGVDSFIALPGSTAMAGGGFTSAPLERAWFDTSNDGPQSNLLFARLTTTGSTGRFAGNMYVRGYDAPVTLPFSFALPGNTADFALLENEPTYSVNYSLDPPPVVTPPPAPPQTPPVVPPPVQPPVTPPNPGLPPTPAPLESVKIVRQTRAVTPDEVAGGAPVGGLVHDFFITSASDLLILSADFDASLFQHTLGSDVVPPTAGSAPGVTADSYITLPSFTSTLGGGMEFGELEQAWYDMNNDGPQENFQFARLTTVGESGTFSGEIFVRGQPGIGIPYSFDLPGTEEHLAQLGSSFEGVFGPPVQPPVVEPSPTSPGPTPSEGPIDVAPTPQPPTENSPSNQYPEVEVPNTSVSPLAENPPAAEPPSAEQPPAKQPPLSQPSTWDPVVDVFEIPLNPESGEIWQPMRPWIWSVDESGNVVRTPLTFPDRLDATLAVEWEEVPDLVNWAWTNHRVLTTGFSSDGATIYAYTAGGINSHGASALAPVARLSGATAEAAIPEPSAPALLLAALVAFPMRRRPLAR